MNWTDVAKSACPVARSLAQVGDRWTLLIMRELFIGVPRFDEIQAETGMSSHLLSSRLRRLETDGILKRAAYNRHPVRYEYRLTAKGQQLYPVLLALKAWGEKWCGFKRGEQRSTKIVHMRCGHETNLQLICPSCKELFGPQDVRTTFAPKFAAERTRRRAAFLSGRRSNNS